MICFQRKKAKITGTLSLIPICLAFFLAAGCGRPSPQVPEKTRGLDQSRFLTAEGSGRSDMDARQQALAQLSSIFEARVSSEFSSRTLSRLSQDQAEEFESEMAAKVHVASGVNLQGARIDKTWKDEAAGEYHALAVLDRMDAAENWASELEILDARIRGTQASLRGAKGPLSQLSALNRIVTLAGERQILESRLSVVDFPVMTLAETVDLGEIMAQRAHLISGLRVFVSIAGEFGSAVGDALAQTLTEKGLALSPDPDQASVRILGEVAVSDLNIGNPSARFARARGNVLVFETRPQTLFVQINDKVRKGHRDLSEARIMAADALGGRLAGQLARALGY